MGLHLLWNVLRRFNVPCFPQRLLLAPANPPYRFHRRWAFHGVAFDHFFFEDGEDVCFIDVHFHHSPQFPADGVDDGFVFQEQGREDEAAGGVLFVAEFEVGAFGESLFGEGVEGILILLGFGVHREDVDGGDQPFVDGLGEDDVVQPPFDGIGEDDPFNALVGTVIDGLFDVAIVEGDADGFHFDEQLEFVSEFDGQVAEGASDGVLGGDVGVFVVAEQIGEQVFDEGGSVSFRDIARALLLDDRGHRFEDLDQTFCDLFWNGHEYLDLFSASMEVPLAVAA